MEKELIIKGLEWHSTGSVDDCKNCPYDRIELADDETCADRMCLDTLQLIKELTEENEKLTINMNAYGLTAKRLAEENERLKSEVSVKKKLLDKCVDLEDRVKADTVREMQERLKEEPIKVGLPLFGLATKNEIEDYANGLMLQMRDAIDRIAEEMLKSRECPQCKHFVGCEPSTLGVCDMYEKKAKG